MYKGCIAMLPYDFSSVGTSCDSDINMAIGLLQFQGTGLEVSSDHLGDDNPSGTTRPVSSTLRPDCNTTVESNNIHLLHKSLTALASFRHRDPHELGF